MLGGDIDLSYVSSLAQMATKSTQGAKLRTPKGFNKLLAVNIGYGVDQHGQDATVRILRLVSGGVVLVKDLGIFFYTGSCREGCPKCNGKHCTARGVVNGPRRVKCHLFCRRRSARTCNLCATLCKTAAIGTDQYVHVITISQLCASHRRTRQSQDQVQNRRP